MCSFPNVFFSKYLMNFTQIISFSVGCRRDSDCTFDKACVNSRCVNPCDVQDRCGRNADCRPIVHRPHCSCKPGFDGNAYDYCKQGLFFRGFIFQFSFISLIVCLDLGSAKFYNDIKLI